jgi:hypothetical protein
MTWEPLTMTTDAGAPNDDQQQQATSNWHTDVDD